MKHLNVASVAWALIAVGAFESYFLVYCKGYTKNLPFWIMDKATYAHTYRTRTMANRGFYYFKSLFCDETLV